MVATDVASRGIGMVDRRSALSLPLPTCSIEVVWPCFCEALLSAYVCAAAVTLWSRLIMISFGYPARSSWMSVAVWLATYSIPSRYVPIGYRGGLDFS